jgi:hypothetical protein
MTLALGIRIDIWFADDLGVPTEALTDAGVRVVTHARRLATYAGVYALRHDDAAVVSAPPDLVEPLRARLTGITARDLIWTGALADALAPRVERVVGPAVLSFVDRKCFRAPSSTYARLVLDTNHAALERLRAACDEAEWAEAGIEAPYLFAHAVFIDGEVAAIAQTRPRWADLRTIGVLAHPAYRRRGYARDAAGAETAEWLAEGEIVQWQALASNTASLATAVSLGFVRRYESLAVRLTA